MGEIIQNLTAQNTKVPNCFAVTVDAYDAFIDENNLKGKSMRHWMVGIPRILFNFVKWGPTLEN
ncbi:hypothetical protein DHD32_14165 [Arenibacter sp. TNZ]|nr:hypothetical protein [Arenibacter sp. TNZ]